MMTRLLKNAAVTMALLSAVSCSLKEDRQDCPCWLEIHLEECSQVRDCPNGQEQMRPVDRVNVSAWNDSPLFRVKVRREDFGHPLEKVVPKSLVSTSVVAGEEKMVRDGYSLMLPRGGDSDEIFAHAAQVPCSGEAASDTARLHKQFARVKVKVTNPVGADYPYTFRLRGDTGGIDLRDLTPLDGRMEMELLRGEGDMMQFRLIRQKEDSRIEIDILEDGDVVETLPVHEWIGALGYNWQALDLEDITIDIDYAKGEIKVSVSEWGDGGSIRIEI